MAVKFKRNNPLNIRYNKRNNWDGQVGEENGFCVFEHEDYGFRAAFKLLKNYGKMGYVTIADIIHRFAPPCENPTSMYTKYIVKRMEMLGYDGNGEPLADFRLDMGNDMIVADLVFCMAKFESGLNVQWKQVMGSLRRMKCINSYDEPTGIADIS